MGELRDLVTKIVAAAKPGEEIEAYASRHRDTEIRAYEGDVESLSSAESAGVGIRVVVDHRQGFAYVGDLDEKLAFEALSEARDNAGFASPDDNVGLAHPDGTAFVDLELFDERLTKISTPDKIELVLELDRRVRSADQRIRQVVSTDYEDGQGESAIATSTGIVASSRRSTCSLSTDVVAGDGDDTQTGVGYSVARSIEGLDPDAAMSDAIERAVRLLGARKPKSAQLDVVLDRRVTATLLSVLARTLSGEEAAKGRSLFNGRLGQDVALDSVTLVDDPTNSLAFGAAHADAEGLACRRNALIDEGKLVGFLYDSYSARLVGTTSTASAVRAGFKSTPGVGARALQLGTGELDRDGILGHVRDGLYVQSISGVHSGVNAISGDFSVGAEGLLIRDGALAEPVREITIASTIQKMLQHILFIGNDVEWLPGLASGVTVAIGDLSMSGV